MSQRAAEGRVAQVRSTTAPAPAPMAAPVAAAPEAVAEEAAAGEPELFDLRALAQTFGNKPEKMRKYANMFIDSAQDGLREVHAALEAGDMQRLSELGHRIKSSARAVGAMSFADLCLALEKMAPADGIERARAIVVQMQPLLDRLREHIAQEMNANSMI
jgi:HPt (histidine-containing phosphotransfer) domain-containing protein